MAISVGSVEVDVVPNTRGIYAQLRSGLVPAATRAGQDAGRAAGRSFGPAMRSEVGNIGLQIGQQIGSQIAARITAEIRGALRNGITQGGAAARPSAARQGDQAGGAFARQLRARLEAAFRSMPKLDVRLSTTGADADLARLRARLETLAGKTIGIDIDAATARAEAADIEERLRRIGAAHPNVTVRADTASARAQLRLLREEIDRVSADPARVRVETDGTFGQRLRAAVQQAQASLPEINIGADTTPAQLEVMRLRAQLGQLADQRVGIDIDAATATARIQAIQARLQALSASDADIDVRVDSAAALAQLATVQAMVNRLDGQTARTRVTVSTQQATRALLQLSIAIASVAAIPAVPVIAAGLGSVTAAATAAGVSIGALGAAAVPAFLDIKNALEAQKSAQDASANATAKGGQAAATAARQGLQMAGAQQALAAAHRNAARQIAQAEESVADAVRSAGEANRRAAQQVRDAKQGLAGAVQQAADRQRSAAEQVLRAEEQLADAQRSARQAQQDLTQARRDAAAELEELSSRLTNARLSERDAALSVQEAQARLAKTQAVGSKATVLEQQRAQLAYDQAVQRLRDQQAETKKLTTQKKVADKAGVEGSSTVQRAQERLAAAQKGVRDQAAGLAKAQQDAARQQVQSQRDIAAAQGKVAEAQRAVTSTQEQGARSVARAQQQLVAAQQSAADSISSAQRQIRSAQLSAAGGADTASAAQAKYREALAAMTPATRGTFNAFVSLRKAFGEWSRSLQPAIMPLFTRALIGMKNALPGLTPFVLEAAKAIGELQERASKGFKSEGWKEFKKDLEGATGPAILGLGSSLANVGKGLGGIIQAFLPHMESISRRMQEITGRFAAWGTGLKGSPEFEGFLSYSSRMAPILAESLGDLFRGFYDLSKALSPLSGPVLEVLGALARGLSDVANTLPGLIQLMYLAFIATRVWTLAMFLFNAVMSANPITLIIIGIVALVAAVVYAYKRFGWFREGVQAAWRGIQIAALGAWNGFLKPAFDGIVGGARMVGRWAGWLWRVGIKPAFDGISLAARILAVVIAVVLIAPMVIGFRLAAGVGTWLWRAALGPAFRGIGTAGKWLHEKAIKPAMNGVVAALQFVGRIGKWLYVNALRPAFRGIAAVAVWLYKYGIKPQIDSVVAVFRFAARIGKWLYEKALRPAFRGIATVASWLYTDGIKPAFGWIADRATWLWRKGLKPAFDRVREGVRLVGKAFGLAKDAIGVAFGKIKSLTKTPVNFVIKWVYTKGIKAVWDKVAGFVGLGKLPAAPKLLAAGGTVGNGFGPARPMVTNRPTAIVGEGNPRHPEYVIPTDPKYRSRAIALHAAAGTQLLEGGGVLGKVWDWTKGAATKGINWAKTGADLLTSPGKIWSKLTKPILSTVAKGVGSSPMGKAVGKFPFRIVGGLKDMVVNAAKSLFASGAGGGQWLRPVNAAYGTPFGKRGSMWSSGRHTGLDFPAATGAAIRAVADGRVSKVASAGPYGKHVQIDHGRGLASLYAHMSKVLTKMRAQVDAGQLIGRVGSTGNSSGPHLHLEARRGGRAVDPMPFLTATKGFSGTAVTAAQKTAKGMLAKYGWGEGHFGPLKQLWHNESGWRWNAKNPSSGAYGIPQSLPASKMASAGRDWKTNPATQIKWGLGYIKSRYGSPTAALDFWNRQIPHWYDQGGYLPEGLSLAYNGTGSPEPVFTTAQADALMRLSSQPTAAGGEFTGQLYLDSGEFLGKVRGEVTAGVDGALTQVRRRARAGLKGG